MIARVIAHQYPESLLAVHFNLFFGPESDEEDTSKLSAGEKKQLEHKLQFQSTGRGYTLIQKTKV